MCSRKTATLITATILVTGCTHTIMVDQRLQTEVPGCQIQVLDVRVDKFIDKTHLTPNSYATIQPVDQLLRNRLCQLLPNTTLTAQLDHADCKAPGGLRQPQVTLRTRVDGHDRSVLSVQGEEYALNMAKQCGHNLTLAIDDVAQQIVGMVSPNTPPESELSK